MDLEPPRNPTLASSASDASNEIAQPPRSRSEGIPLPGSIPQLLSEPQKQSTVESKLGRQTSVDSKVSGQLRQASMDSISSQQNKWTRQVSWMAEKSRNITQAASVLHDDEADVPKFQAHQIWQEKEDSVSFRSSRRPSVCTMNLLVHSRRKSFISPLALEGWSAVAILMIFMEGFRPAVCFFVCLFVCLFVSCVCVFRVWTGLVWAGLLSRSCPVPSCLCCVSNKRW